MWSQSKAIWQTSSQESHPLFQSTYWKHASSIFSVSAELIFCTTASEYFLHRNRKSTLSLCTSSSLNLAKARGTDTKACLVCLPVCSWQWKLIYSFQEPSHTMLERSQALGGPTRTMLWSWAAWGTKLLCPLVLPLARRGCSIKANGCKPLHVTLICKWWMRGKATACPLLRTCSLCIF